MDHEQCISLLDFVKEVPDPRKARGQRYSWELMLGLICAGLAAGQKTAWAIARWAKHQQAELCRLLQARRMPSYATLYRALRSLDVEALEVQLAAYARRVEELEDAGDGSEAAAAQRWRGQSVDGKLIRGAGAHGVSIQLLGLVRHGQATVLGQRRVSEGTNELGALPDLLAGGDLTDTVTTLDALFTQRAVAQQIIDRRGHYLMVVKKNQPTLYADLETFFDSAPLPPGEDDRQSDTSAGCAHGRFERRTLVSSELLNDYLDWPGVAQVMRRTCERTILSTGARSCTLTYAITSLTRAQAKAQDLEGLWRNHWTIENGLHDVRDETLGEDRGQAWKGPTAQALAALRNGLLAAMRRRGWRSMADALRFYSGDLSRALRLVGALAT